MMMEIRKAHTDDFKAVRAFFHELIDTSAYVPMWEKDIFPDNDILLNAINKGELFIGVLDSKIVSAVIVADNGDLTKIDLLGVLPAFSRRGFARQMVKFAVDTATARGHRAVRLDVLEDNTAAEALYISMGFVHIGIYEEYYERTGKMIFNIYEYTL